VQNIASYDALRKQGAGTANLFGNETFENGIEVHAGTLAIEGTFAARRRSP
jgi:hypothetical protein